MGGDQPLRPTITVLQLGLCCLRIEDLHSQSVNNNDLSGCNKHKLSDYEAEIMILLGRAKSLSSDHEKDNTEIALLKKALDKARIVREMFYVFLKIIGQPSVQLADSILMAMGKEPITCEKRRNRD